jgi:ABC-type spermidine/putrescine transport system permease subunit I
MRPGRLMEIGLLAPLALAIGTFVVLPAGVLFGASLFTWAFSAPDEGPTLANYGEVLSNPITWRVLLNSVEIAVPVTLICVAGGFMLAYRMVFVPGAGSQLLFVLVVTALMASFLVRIYAWRTLLGTRGVINGALQGLGLTEAPVDLLLFSTQAVIVAQVSLFLPVAALTFFAALSGIDPSLAEAARDLGASRTSTLWRVTMPLCGPTLLTTTALIFFLACGDYLTPVFVGGPQSVTVGRIIADSFGVQADYGLGAATSILLLLGFVLVFVILRASMRMALLLPDRVG